MRCRMLSHLASIRQHMSRGDKTRTGGMGASNWPLPRCNRQDTTTSATSWGLSGAKIPACEPVALLGRSSRRALRRCELG